VLELTDVTVAYGAVRAVERVSLRVDRGEVVLLVGHNGAGKSTIAKTIAGLLRPETGAIRLDGRSLILPPHEVVRRGVSLVPEGRRIFPLQTVEDNLILGAFLHRRQKARVAEAMAKVIALFPVLARKRQALASTLSGGEQQMLAIGQALMVGPAFLICDEPSLGLAPRIAEELFAGLQEINRQGATILLLEQRVRMALMIAGRGYVLETGRVVLEGTRAELEEDPRVIEAYLGRVREHPSASGRGGP
jgi:branched-chain amino acid transport system ATP-binding protein